MLPIVPVFWGAGVFPHPKSHRGAIAPAAKNRTEGGSPEVGGEGAEPRRIRERYELAEELAPRYRRARRRERREILDGFCLATGYERKHAWRVLRGRKRVSPKRRAPRTRRYGLEFRRALKVCWEATDYLCAERLQPLLPDLLLRLRRHGQPDGSPETGSPLVGASLSTVERSLHDLRRGLVSPRTSRTKPGGLLRRQVPLVVDQWRELDTPG